jgi:hypothetical protein
MGGGKWGYLVSIDIIAVFLKWVFGGMEISRKKAGDGDGDGDGNGYGVGKTLP